MATFKEECPKYKSRKAHGGHSWKRTRYTLGGKVTDVYKCPGIRSFGR